MAVRVHLLFSLPSPSLPPSLSSPSLPPLPPFPLPPPSPLPLSSSLEMLEKTEVPHITEGYPLVVAMTALMDAVKSVSLVICDKVKIKTHVAQFLRHSPSPGEQHSN